MAGILDKKMRFMDSFLTDQGRNELAKGELRFSFATFSDLGTYYDSSIENPNVAEDASSRIMFEAFNRSQDLVIPEFDSDGGMLFPAGQFDIVNNELKIIDGDKKLLKGESLVLSSSIAISDTMNSFSDMYPLRTEEVIKKTTGFELNLNSKNFIIDEFKPFHTNKPSIIDIDNSESLWQDKKLSHVANFQYLPPINSVSKSVLRQFSKIEQDSPQSYEDIRKELEGDRAGFTGVGDPARIRFDKTSAANNLICQVWEVTSSSMTKLRAIDFGEFEDSDPYKPSKHVFYIGKLYDDSSGDKTFVNLFTMVFN